MYNLCEIFFIYSKEQDFTLHVSIVVIVEKFFTLTEMVHEKTACSTFKRLDHSIFNPKIEKNRLSYM